MNLTAKLVAVTALATVGTVALAGPAHAKNCGGQNAAPQPVPYTCTLPPKVIDGTAFSAVVTANGTIVTVAIHMAAPRAVDTPVRIVHHVDISGAGGASDQAQGVIPAGQTDATLVDSVPCRAGQLDIKAVFTGNGQGEGRIGGPWITNGTDCLTGQTIPTTAPPPADSSVPGTPTTTAGPPPAGPSSSVPGTPPTARTLPATDRLDVALWVVFACFLIFAGFCLASKHRGGVHNQNTDPGWPAP